VLKSIGKEGKISEKEERETSQHGAKFFNLPEVVCDLVLL
jgi:hypothetical protein